jgi:hypothetical protein
MIHGTNDVSTFNFQKKFVFNICLKYISIRRKHYKILKYSAGQFSKYFKIKVVVEYCFAPGTAEVP